MVPPRGLIPRSRPELWAVLGGMNPLLPPRPLASSANCWRFGAAAMLKPPPSLTLGSGLQVISLIQGWAIL